MAEVVATYDTPVSDESDAFRARVVGRAADDHMWEGWIEFIPTHGDADPVVGSVESRQPNRTDLVYWATGLTAVYLEGALRRAKNPVTVRVRAAELPASDRPAPRAVRVMLAGDPTPEPVLDPFEIGGRSLDILRQELSAVGRPRLRNIIAAYDLNPRGEDLEWMSDAQLITFIVTATEARIVQRAR